MAAEHNLLAVGILAAVFQLVGYIVYYRKTIKGEIDPEPVTWLMFGYGTMLLFFLELDKDASFAELLLPFTCAVCGVMIALRIWRSAYLKSGATKPMYRYWPDEWSLRYIDTWDTYSLISDYVITVGYVLAWAVVVFTPEHTWLTPEGRETAAWWFLIGSNLSTFPGFVPILKKTWQKPGNEHWLPWTIWTAAYTLLFVVTFLNPSVTYPETWQFWSWDASFTAWLGLLAYPASNMVMHALVALFALPYRQRKACAQVIHPHPGE